MGEMTDEHDTIENEILKIIEEMWEKCVEAKQHFDAYSKKDTSVNPCYARSNADEIHEAWYFLLDNATAYHKFFTRIYQTVQKTKGERMIDKQDRFISSQSNGVAEDKPKPVTLEDIKCDRCGERARFEADGGNCQECGDNLCADCALWHETVDYRVICKRCSDAEDRQMAGKQE